MSYPGFRILVFFALLLPSTVRSADFTDVATSTIADATGKARGVAWGDYDKDGDLDLYVVNNGATNANHLYRNDGAGTFTDVSAASHTDDAGPGEGAAWGDYDNDGDLDLYVANYLQPNRLYRNDGFGTFTEVAAILHVDDARPSFGVAWGDYDRDGDLDLFVANLGAENRLYRNDGTAGFTDVAATLGVNDGGQSAVPVWGDYDNDGDLDLYVAKVNEPNRLLRNDGAGFTDVGAATGTNDAGRGSAAAWGDYDNDGDLDLYLGNGDTPSRLYRNEGGSFTEVGAISHTDNVGGASQAVAWGDYDNDGDLDLYVVNFVSANKLYRNEGNGTFIDVGGTSGTGNSGRGEGCAWGDYDKDGDLDLYVANDNQSNKLFRNDSINGNHWLQVSLVGRSSNRSGIGARVRTVANLLSRIRQVESGSGLTQNMLGAEFGVGAASVVDSVIVRWPSGIVQVQTGIPADHQVTLTEPTLVIGDRSIAEGDNSSSSEVVYVSLTGAVASTVTVDFATADSTATVADGDYQAASGTLTFLPGETSQPIAVTLNGDGTAEGAEVFKINLSNAVGATIADFRGVSEIADDDADQFVRGSLYVTDGVVNAVAVSGDRLYIGGSFTHVGPATGGAVPIAASSGLPLAMPKVAGRVFAAAADGAGGWYIGGLFTHLGGVPRANLAHLRSDYTLDAWDAGSNGQVFALSVSGSTVYVGGQFTSIGGQARNNLAAIDATSGLTTSWNPNSNGYVAALLVSGTAVYAGGQFTTIGGQPRTNIAALDAASGFATSWSPNADNVVSALAAIGSTVYAGGQFTNIGGGPRAFIAALDANGVATSWNPNANGVVAALAVNGATVYAGGAFTNIGGQTRNRIAALMPDGTASGWNPDAGYAVTALAVNTGTVYAGGSFTTMGGMTRNRIAALNTSTGAPLDWTPNANDEVLAVAVSGSTVFAGGGFTSIGSEPHSNIAALDASTGVPIPWANADGPVNALAVSGATVYGGGGFSSIGGGGHNYVAALDAVTGVARAWDPDADGAVLALAVKGTTVYVGGDFTFVNDFVQRVGIAAFDSSSGVVTPWNPHSDGRVRALAVSGTTVYAGGDFLNIGGQQRLRIAALDASGNATAWAPDASGSVRALAVSGSTVYAGGDFIVVGGQVRTHLAALDANGVATAWNPSPNGQVRALAVSGTNVCAGGFFTQMGGEKRNRIAALDAVSGGVTPWNPDANNTVNALALNGATVYAGGFPTIVGNLPQRGIACLVDPQFVDVPVRDPLAEVAFARVAPNPTTSHPRFHFDLPRAARVRIAVFDVLGRLVARPVDALYPAGSHVVTWEEGARTGRGGLYFVRFEAEGLVLTRRLVLIE